MCKLEDILAASKLNGLLQKEEDEMKVKRCIGTILALIGAVVAIGAIAYGVYRFFIQDEMDDFDEDFYFDDEEMEAFFDEEEPEAEEKGEEPKSTEE